MEEEEIEEKIDEEGYIRANVIFEVVGNPKEHVEESLQAYMENLKTDSKIEILEEDYNEPEEVEDGLFSAFVDSEMLIQGLEKLTWLCYNFSPASIEIMEPVEYHFKAHDLQNWINDFLSKLHEVGQMSKQISSQNKLLVKNFNRLIKNSILLCIEMGADTPAEVSEKIGVPADQLKDFFQALIQEGRLELHDEQYEKVD